MTIQHLGGVFGRNPTYNNVTIEGQVVVSSGASTFNSDSSANTVNFDGRSSDNIAQVNFRPNGGASNYSQIQSRSTELFVKTIASIPMSFHTNNTRAAYIDDSQNFIVGNTTVPTTNVGGAALSPNDNDRVILKLGTTGTSSLNLAEFFNPNGRVGSISTSASATTFSTSSDQRLKDNIIDAPSACDDIDAIQVRSFVWKAGGAHQKYGMVAQELLSVAPEAVTGDADSDEMMGVDYSKLVPMMMKEIQSLRARVAQLEGVN